MKILLVGAGGYGVKYVDYLLSGADMSLTLAGVVEPYFDACGRKAALLAAGIPVYATMEEFYAVESAELAIICTPPFLHETQSVVALEHGSFVLCEKPVAPTLEEAHRMSQAADKHGKWIAVGYQWSFADAILALKRDILAGRLGKPLLFRTMACVPRKKEYYTRGVGWAGKIEKDGITVWDSILSNACAHYVHNMFFLLGEDMEGAALPLFVQAECLRVNDIETFDTCALRMRMPQGATAYLIVSHATREKIDPTFVYEFERATVTYENGQIVAAFTDGDRVCYGDPFENDMRKISDCARAIEAGTVPHCTVKAASAHTALIEALHGHLRVSAFSAETVRDNGERVWVDGLCDVMCACYKRAQMLSEQGIGAEKICFEVR